MSAALFDIFMKLHLYQIHYIFKSITSSNHIQYTLIVYIFLFSFLLYTRLHYSICLRVWFLFTAWQHPRCSKTPQPEITNCRPSPVSILRPPSRSCSPSSGRLARRPPCKQASPHSAGRPPSISWR